MSANSARASVLSPAESTTPMTSEAEVLYQKLGDRWFAFSIIDGEVFMAPVSEETIQEVKRVERN